MATHSGILAWETPWAEEPGELQSMGLQRAGHDKHACVLQFKQYWKIPHSLLLKPNPCPDTSGGELFSF